jgi:hypothetical protein
MLSAQLRGVGVTGEILVAARMQGWQVGVRVGHALLRRALHQQR